MRNLLNILIMVFVVGAIWYQVKNSDFPALSNYVASTESQLQALKDDVPDSLKNIFTPLTSAGTSTNLNTLTNLSSLGDVNLNTLTNLINPKGNTTASTPLGALQSALPSAISKIIPSASTGTPTGSSTLQSSPTIQVQTNGTGSAGDLTVEGIIAQTNIQRKSLGFTPLTESAQLDASAQFKANDLLKNQYFAHVAPDGKTVADTVAAQGYTYIKIGENLALGNFAGDSDVVNAWMNSPEHRANMLDPTFTEMGVGVVYGMYQGRMVSIAVQHFGRPRSTCPAVSDALKTQVQDGQQELDTMSASLSALKTQIDSGQSAGQDENTNVALYNSGVDKYQSEYTSVEALRVKYNDEVSAFNSCIGS